jgi:aminodeoxyfutalosine deaminase
VVLPIVGPALSDGAVAVRDGRIQAVGTHDDLSAALRGEPGVQHIEWPGVIIPGLVNAHTHLQFTDLAEVGRGCYSGFEDWAGAFVSAYSAGHDWRASAARGADIALWSGTTAIADVVTDPAAGGALHDAGLHGVAFMEVFAWTSARWRREGLRFLNDRLAETPAPPAPGISPHAVYSLGSEVIRDLAAIAAERGLRQHIHAAESAYEDEFTRAGTGALADQWRGKGYEEFELLSSGGSGRGVIAYLESIGVLTSSTHLAHGIYVDANDRALLRARGVPVALCPRSNAIIGLEPAPVAAYLREGNALAVGTDSLASSPSLNVLDDVAALYQIARAQGYHSPDLHARLLEAATLGGARALGLAGGAGGAGALYPGARADLVVFATRSTLPADVLAELVEPEATPVMATIVEGRIRSIDVEMTQIARP